MLNSDIFVLLNATSIIPSKDFSLVVKNKFIFSNLHPQFFKIKKHGNAQLRDVL